MRCAAFCVALIMTFPSALWAQADTAELLRRIQTLEQRVDKLEQSRKPVSAATVGSQDRSSWRSMKRGMTMDQVRGVLGEPQRVQMFGIFTMWNYSSGGYVQFNDRDLLEQIHEPR